MYPFFQDNKSSLDTSHEGQTGSTPAGPEDIIDEQYSFRTAFRKVP